MKKTSRRESGQQGEQIALEALIAAGYTIRAHNWRCPSGEIDLIAEYNGDLVIVEVRARHADLDAALESISPAKQRRLIALVDFYQAAESLDMPVRIDVVVVDLRDGHAEIIESAVGW
jgi:putative endonuclease